MSAAHTAQPYGWAITYQSENGERTVFKRHNSVGDYRDIDPKAYSLAVYAAPPPPTAQPVIAPEWVMLTEDEMWNAVKNCRLFDLKETGNSIQAAFIAKQKGGAK